MTWAISMVQKLRLVDAPNSLPTKTNISIREIPVMISGFVMGISVTVFITALDHFARSLLMPTAAAVPMIVEITVAEAARTKVLRTASRVLRSFSSSRYHFREKPVNFTGSLDSLKEKTITTAIGRYIRKKINPI